jgi:amino acid transporter
MMRVDH